MSEKLAQHHCWITLELEGITRSYDIGAVDESFSPFDTEFDIYQHSVKPGKPIESQLSGACWCCGMTLHFVFWDEPTSRSRTKICTLPRLRSPCSLRADCPGLNHPDCPHFADWLYAYNDGKFGRDVPTRFG